MPFSGFVENGTVYVLNESANNLSMIFKKKKIYSEKNVVKRIRG